MSKSSANDISKLENIKKQNAKPKSQFILNIKPLKR